MAAASRAMSGGGDQRDGDAAAREMGDGGGVHRDWNGGGSQRDGDAGGLWACLMESRGEMPAAAACLMESTHPP